ncbi:MAG: A24 family peptidase, partial [Nanoarchaeota archaeon]
MMIFPELVLIILALVWLVFATIQDVKTREVADWLNFSLIIFALCFRFFYSLFSTSWWFFIYGVVGLIVFVLIGNLFYYSRIFAGGDAKLLMALGVVLPFGGTFMSNLLIFSVFLFLFLLCGGLYGVFYSFVLISTDFNKFRQEFYKIFKEKKNFIYISLFAAILLIIFGFWVKMIAILALVVFVLPYLFIMAKSVEEVFMIKKINVKNLREGD